MIIDNIFKMENNLNKKIIFIVLALLLLIDYINVIIRAFYNIHDSFTV